MYRLLLFLSLAISTIETQPNGVVLVIIDGFGESPLDSEAPVAVANAVEEAFTPNMDRWKQEFGFSNLLASEVVVGLREGDVGNSIVGHQTIGLGRTEPWYPQRIELDVQKGAFMTNTVLLDTLRHAGGGNGNGRLHLIGMLDGTSVDADYVYLLHLLDGLNDHPEVSEIYVHVHTTSDNREPATFFIESVLGALDGNENAHMGTVMGSFFPMDRTGNWEETIKVAYEVWVGGRHATRVPQEDLLRYVEEQTDEVGDYYLEPILVDPNSLIRNGDSILTMTYREDSMIQITAALGYGPGGGPDDEPDFVDFESDLPHPEGLYLTTLTQYDFRFPFPVMYEPPIPRNGIGEIVSNAGLRQVRIAESYKMRHIQAFFSGGIANYEPYPGEDRITLESPSPRVPEMAMYEVGAETVKSIKERVYSLVAVNLAGPDALGHIGVYPDVVDAVTATDEVLGQIFEAAIANNYLMIVTADHGHSEKMVFIDGSTDSGHTRNPVPLFVLDHNYQIDASQIGKTESLANIAASVLTVLDLQIPEEMEPSLLMEGKERDSWLHTVPQSEIILVSSVSVGFLLLLFVFSGVRRMRMKTASSSSGVADTPNSLKEVLTQQPPTAMGNVQAPMGLTQRLEPGDMTEEMRQAYGAAVLF